jgi:tRNA (adenine57-N1/adenine58-N1)-methyltransferase
MMKTLIREDKKFLVRDEKKDFHCQYGFIRAEELMKTKEGDVLKTNKEVELTILEPGFMDLYEKIKRGPQIIPLKDIGTIISNTGIGKKSVVLEAGGGSGGLTVFLSNICKKVYTYEIRTDHIEILKKNIELMGLKNVIIKNSDVYENILQKNIDVVVLDLPEPWKAVGSCRKALKVGGFVCVYSPTIPQTADFVNTLPEDFIHMDTVEVIERQWEIKERKVRPKSIGIGHSGFLTFARKIR